MPITYESHLLHALQRARAHPADSPGKIGYREYMQIGRLHSAPSSPPTSRAPLRKTHEHDEDNSCFVLETLMDTITAVTTQHVLSDSSDDDLQQHVFHEQLPQTARRSGSVDTLAEPRPPASSGFSSSADDLWSHCNELASLARDDVMHAAPRMTNARLPGDTGAHALWSDRRQNISKGRPAALAIPRSVPDLSQHASSHALASSFDNLTSYLGADMNMHYMSGQRRHPSLARDAVPLINPHSVMLPSQMRAPGTPKSRQSREDTPAMPRLETDWTGVDLRPTQDLFGNIIGIGHTMSTSKRSDALSASLSAHVPESASATSRTGEAEAPTASALPSESDLNVKAAPFVPASAPVTPNLSLSTADEKKKPANWCETTVCKHAPNCERFMKGKCRFWPCNTLSPKTLKKSAEATKMGSPLMQHSGRAPGPRAFGAQAQMMTVMGSLDIRRQYY